MEKKGIAQKIVLWFIAALVMTGVIYASSITAHAVSGPRPSQEAGIVIGYTHVGDWEILYLGSDKKTSAKFGGFSYSKKTNTLTISNTGYNEDYYLELYDMGDDFTIDVKGKNSLGYIGMYSNVNDRMNLTITGSGSLKINSGGSYGAAIHGYANGKSNTKVTIDNTVNVTLHGGENIFTGKKEKAIVVENAKSSKQANVFRIGGKKTGSTTVVRKKTKKGYTYSYGSYSLKIKKSGDSFLKNSPAKSDTPAVKTYTIKYNLNGGTGSFKNQEKTQGKNLTLRKGEPTKSGAIFLGWAEKKDGSVAYQPGGKYKKDSSVTLYAKWRKTVTSTDDPYMKGYTASKFKYPAFEKMASSGSFAIPGISSSCSTTDGFVGECDEMVPQGICVAEGYIFITEYCKGYKHNSVLQVLRKSDKKYIGTVTLGHIPKQTKIELSDHNGGIAYDNHGYLWIANSISGYVSAVSLNEVVEKAEAGGKNKAPLVDYYDSYDCRDGNGNMIKAASFVTYYNSNLWVGYCNQSSNKSTLYAYNISYISGKPTAIFYERAWPVEHHANGAVFVKKGGKQYVIITSQTGKQDDSRIISYLLVDDGMQCRFKKIKSFPLPPLLEELEISGNRIYSVFESAAKPYRSGVKTYNSVKLNLGRVCIGEKSNILEMLEIG